VTIRLALLICFTCVCHAELQRIDTIKTESFGTDYQIITGTAHFALDPRLPANKSIVDLVLAPRNSRGLVEATADLVIIQPRDPARANGTVLFEVSNRGGFSVLNVFNASANGSMQAGNEFLMRRGYTVAWLGWQFGLASTAKFRIDVPKGSGERDGSLVRLRAERLHAASQSARRLLCVHLLKSKRTALHEHNSARRETTCAARKVGLA
jgi:hypothetical protein